MLSEKRFAWTPVPYAAARWLHSVYRIRVSPTERYKVYHKIRQMTEKFTFKNDYDIHINLFGLTFSRVKSVVVACAINAKCFAADFPVAAAGCQIARPSAIVCNRSVADGHRPGIGNCGSWKCFRSQFRRGTVDETFSALPMTTTLWIAYKLCRHSEPAYLPGVEVNRDQSGGSSRVRPGHCTPIGLTPASIPNVDTSDA
ncbi:hypothetical protein QTP88_018412 [Uroleucon formosanum]